MHKYIHVLSTSSFRLKRGWLLSLLGAENKLSKWPRLRKFEVTLWKGGCVSLGVRRHILTLPPWTWAESWLKAHPWYSLEMCEIWVMIEKTLFVHCIENIVVSPERDLRKIQLEFNISVNDPIVILNVLFLLIFHVFTLILDFIIPSKWSTVISKYYFWKIMFCIYFSFF